MGNQVGDINGIKEQHKPCTGGSDHLHHELHSTPHSHLLKHATSSRHAHAHSEHLPAFCIAEPPRERSIVADEDQNQDKLLSRIALAGFLLKPVNPEQPNKNAIKGHDAHSNHAAHRAGEKPSSLVADEDQNQDKLTSHQILHSPERKSSSPIADEDRNQDKLTSRFILNNPEKK